jgi:hypothetical protein
MFSKLLVTGLTLLSLLAASVAANPITLAPAGPTIPSKTIDLRQAGEPTSTQVNQALASGSTTSVGDGPPGFIEFCANASFVDCSVWEYSVGVCSTSSPSSFTINRDAHSC